MVEKGYKSGRRGQEGKKKEEEEKEGKQTEIKMVHLLFFLDLRPHMYLTFF
jgi:hypothetical protein